jgi:cytochrome c-type protein NapC
MLEENLAHFTVVILICISILMLVLLLTRPNLNKGTLGKIMTFLAIFLFPTLSAVTGFFLTMNNATSVEFCMSCHEMEVYGKSLRVDDDEHFVANHFLNKRIAEKNACFTCHTSYTMFGDFESKYRGMKHLYVHYLGSIPDTLKLYSEYENRECLHCHDGGKDYILTDAHNETETMLEEMKKDEISCLQSGCHDVAHEIHDSEDLEYWEDTK